MSTPNDGGPAFPSPRHPASLKNGMTLRQWYKGEALKLIDSRYTNAGNEAACVYEVARYAGMMADALLAEDAAFAERAKGTKP